jgi:hypothetical protein
MRRMLRPALAIASVVVLAAGAAACASSPAMRSPLRERLAAADTPTVEDATRDCLNSLGWTADPIGSVSGGSNVVSAKNKDKEQTQVFVHQADQKPRVTGGPDDDKFWKCLAQKLGGGGGASDESGDGGTDKGDKDKGDKKDGDKPPQDPGDKGGGAS